MSKPTSQTPKDVHAAARGFSLVELLIVLAILALIVGMSWPALQKPWYKSRLRSAAKMLQSELGRARVEAIESGRSIRFQYQPNSGRFVIQPGLAIDLAADSSQDSAAIIDTGGQFGEIDEADDEELPEGVFFSSIEPRNALELSLDRAADDTIAAVEVEDSQPLQWSKPITFFANGRVTGGCFRLVGRHGYRLDVELRGLTAAVKIGKIERRSTEIGQGEMPPQSGGERE